MVNLPMHASRSGKYTSTRWKRESPKGAISQEKLRPYQNELLSRLQCTPFLLTELPNSFQHTLMIELTWMSCRGWSKNTKNAHSELPFRAIQNEHNWCFKNSLLLQFLLILMDSFFFEDVTLSGPFTSTSQTQMNKIVPHSSCWTFKTKQ